MNETMELKMVKNAYNIPDEQLEYYKKEIMEFLPKYRYKSDRHYNPTDRGVDALLKVYNENKGWLYPYFMNHPNYIGNGKIAFSSDYHRKVNINGCQDYLTWVQDCVNTFYREFELKYGGMTYIEAKTSAVKIENLLYYMNQISSSHLGSGYANCKINGMSKAEFETEYFRICEIRDSIYSKGKYIGNNHVLPIDKYKEWQDLTTFLSKVYDNPHMLTTKEEVDELNSLTKSLDLRIVAGQKFSRILGKFCKKLGIDKKEEYLQKFAKFGDDINELDIKRHTIISINPIDYLSMSFGNSWASCHTIDKLNDRNCPNSYSGQYSGGTLSYMLDGSTVVFYTVDKSYDGTDFEFQNKVNRCMFNLGEDKLIQGRVYPQSNDGDQTIYDEVRAIMQKTVSEMFNVNNMWIFKQGISACASVTDSQGSHYRDYLNFGNCNVSWLKPSEGKLKNNNTIIIGHNGICPTCGVEHHLSNYIICDDCVRQVKRCPHCGKRVNEDDHIEIDGQVYCSNCAKWCVHHQRWEIDTPMHPLHTNAYMHVWSTRDVVTRCEFTNNYICDQAIEENPNRYKRDTPSRKYFDVTVWTDGIDVHTFLYNGEERTSYYASKDFAKHCGFREAYNNKWYYKSYLIYDRHKQVKAFVPKNEWNYEFNCWNGIVDVVREQNEKLIQREARRAAREARRAAENAA